MRETLTIFSRLHFILCPSIFRLLSIPFILNDDTHGRWRKETEVNGRRVDESVEHLMSSCPLMFIIITTFCM